MAVDLEAAFLFEETADQVTDDHGDGEALTTGDILQLIEAFRIEPDSDFLVQVHGRTSEGSAGQRVATRGLAPWPAPKVAFETWE